MINNNIPIQIDQISNNKHEHNPNKSYCEQNQEINNPEQVEQIEAIKCKKPKSQSKTQVSALLLFTLFMFFAFCAVYGGIFVGFHEDIHRYMCSDKQFLDWCLATGIFNLIYAFFLLILLVIRALCNLTKGVIFFQSFFVLPVGIIGTLVFCIALSAVDNYSCEDLHILTMVYYIMSYSIIGLIFIYFIFLSICGKSKNSQNELQKIEQTETKP